MAKIKGAKFPRQGLKHIHSEVTVSTQAGRRRDTAFYACVRIGGLRYTKPPGSHAVVRSSISTCSYGRTPRKAIAKALTKAARGVRGRRGVFGVT